MALARLSGPIPDPMTVRPSVPPDLAAITRRALALDPRDRWASASVMADALEATLAPGGSPPRRSSRAWRAARRPPDRGLQAGAVAAGALVGATVVSATARPNPAGIPYAPDAYVGADDGRAGRAAAGAADDAADRRAARGRGHQPAGLGRRRVALLLLAAVAFLVFQLASGGGTPPAEQVTVPNFVGMTSAAASQQADDASG